MSTISIEYKSWTAGKIEGSLTTDLDKRVEELIRIRESLTKTLQDELDFIYDVVAHREMQGKA
jgi:hypothetical protein